MLHLKQGQCPAACLGQAGQHRFRPDPLRETSSMLQRTSSSGPRPICNSCGGPLELRKVPCSIPSPASRCPFGMPELTRCLRPSTSQSLPVKPLSVIGERWPVDQIFHKKEGSISHPIRREHLNRGSCQALLREGQPHRIRDGVSKEGLRRQSRCQHRCRNQRCCLSL